MADGDAQQQIALLQAEIDRRLAGVQQQIDQLLAAARERAATMQLQLDQRFAAEAEARQAALETAKDAVRAALISAQTAVDKAEGATERRFASVNEFRQTLTDQASKFPTREEVAVRMDALQAAVDRNSEALRDVELRFTGRLDTAAGSLAGAAGARGEQRLNISQVIAALAVLVAVITVILYAIKK